MSVNFEREITDEHMRRGVFLYNTHGTAFTTDPEGALQRKADVRALFDDWVEVETRPTYQENVEQLGKVVRRGDLVWSYTGDSGPRIAAEVFVKKTRQDPANINHFSLVADDGGSTSDWAYAMFKDPSVSPAELLDPQSSRRARVFGLQSRITKPGEQPVEQFASTQIGGNFSGKCVEVLNSDDHRERFGYQWPWSRQLLKYLAVAKGIGESSVFNVEDRLTNPEGEPYVAARRVFERCFYASNVAADKGRPPVHPEESRFFMAEARDKNIFSLVRQMLQLRRGTIAGRYYGHDQSVEFRLLDRITLQHDGEEEVLPEDTQVKIQLADQPYAAITNRP